VNPWACSKAKTSADRAGDEGEGRAALDRAIDPSAGKVFRRLHQKTLGRAKQIGDEGQYQFIRGALKKTAAVKKMLERQMLAIKNAMLISQQAQASAQFAESMDNMARQISAIFGEMDRDARTQAQWKKAVAQAGSMEERMELFFRQHGRRRPHGRRGDDGARGPCQR
jgi:hypothetical protein